MFNRALTVIALSLAAAGAAHAAPVAAQEEWGNARPSAEVARGSQGQTFAPVSVHALPANDLMTYNQTQAGAATTRAQVAADTQRWMNSGLRQYGAGEGGALYFANTRSALQQYSQPTTAVGE